MAKPNIWQMTRIPVRSSFSCHSSIPSEACFRHTTIQRTFSTSPVYLRRTKDHNKDRGVSLMRGTGYRQRQTQLRPNPDKPLPEPVLDRAKRTKVEVDDDHGLWAFFPSNKQSMSFDKDEISYGRHWSKTELRSKSWEDLHKLWWICLKERSRLSTILTERQRLEASHGDHNFQAKIRVIRATQMNIKNVLTTRWYAWEDARKIAATDESVDLTGEGLGGAYSPEKDRTSGLFDPEAEPIRPYSETVNQAVARP